MRLFINCSEPARQETHNQFSEKFSKLNQDTLTVCYALAENTFAVSQYLPGKKYNSRNIHNKSVISCGDIIPGTEVFVFDKDSEGVGEIGIRGEYLFHSFIDGSIPLRDGYYLTGDLGFLSENNELFITGRKKDIVIINGKNIYPQDVEHAVSNLAGIYPGRVVAFGILNEVTGSEELFVLAEKVGSINNNELKLAIQKAVEAEIYILAKRVEILEHMSLVKTSSGKISRSRNKELYQSGDLKGL
jgi:fatty-acyl-CoA synthase